MLAFAVSLLAVPVAGASAATVTVDDDLSDCPAADYTSVQQAVNGAEFGDTVVICPGDYVEGPGTVASNGVLINKSLTIKGAGADLVSIRPKAITPNGGQIAANVPDLRDGVGNVITVEGSPTFPISVDISGVTVTGGGTRTVFEGTEIWDGEFEHGVYAEAGIVFLDAGGSVSASRVTNIVTSERPGAYDQPGGYRSNDLGWAIAQVTAAKTRPPGATVRELTVTGTRLDRYNRGGLLVDSATGDSLPLTPSGVVNSATVAGSQIVGRNLNSPPNDGTGGGSLLTTGPLFGQDGVRVTAGSALDLSSSSITQNLMAGTGANTIENWPGAAGVRLVGAEASSAIRSNVLENSFGMVNVGLDGATANTAVPVEATENFWGYPGTSNATNTGPAVSPAAIPTLPANPVNGAVDGTFGSDAVHFVPYRDGAMADTDTGYWPIQDAPVPVADAPPSVSLTAGPSEVGPGGEITLTADASDDFGVSTLLFYSGADQVGEVKPPADSLTLTAPEQCGQVALSVVAVDSLGQTASDEATVDVVDCQQPPEPTDPPTIELSSPPATIGQDGATVAAEVTAEAGVFSVEFLLGERSVCTVTAAPFECRILPDGSEVGSQVIRAVVTDTENRTAADSAPTEVSRFTPKRLTLKAKRTGRKKVVIRANGKLVLPDRVTPAQGCTASRVTVIAKQGRKTVVNRQVALKADCSYSLGFKAKKNPKKKRQKVRIKARFGGNTVLTGATAKRSIR